jgi:hypothetical protein
VDNVSSDPPVSGFPIVPHGKPGLLLSAMAGLQAGIVGVAWMFACFLTAAFWNGQSIWSMPNIFSTVFYGENVYADDFSRRTWAGMALIVVLYGLLGAIWGCIWKDRRKSLLSIFGALAGLAIYYLFFDFIWIHANPLIPLYAPARQLQVAHILWGIALARSPGYSRRIERAIAPPVLPEAAGGSGQEAAAIVSGELIR